MFIWDNVHMMFGYKTKNNVHVKASQQGPPSNRVKNSTTAQTAIVHPFGTLSKTEPRRKTARPNNLSPSRTPQVAKVAGPSRKQPSIRQKRDSVECRLQKKSNISSTERLARSSARPIAAQPNALTFLWYLRMARESVPELLTIAALFLLALLA